MESVRKAYDGIASDWNAVRSRQRRWMPLFKKYFRKDGVVLDAGCGNGINACEIASVCNKVVLLDFSKGQLNEARKNLAGLKNAEFVCGELVKLPFSSDCFDVVCCFAVLHHLSEKEQPKAFSELARVLKPGGLLLVTVWNKRRKKFALLKKNWAFVNWRNGVKRYYYFFDVGGLAEKLKGFELLESFFESKGVRVEEEGADNLCLVFRKK